MSQSALGLLEDLARGVGAGRWGWPVALGDDAWWHAGRGARTAARAYVLGAFVALFLLAGLVQAQVAESLVRWPHYKELVGPGAGAGLADVALDVETLDRARDDLGDLRLYDTSGNEVPYALRIRRDVHSSDDFEAVEFNRGVADGARQISYDLGAAVKEHNEVEVDTAGQNFRRPVDVEGSYDGASWARLVSGALIFRFSSSAGGGVDERTVRYPVSRYRFLRVRVHRDPQTDGNAPVVRGVTIRRTLRIQGEVQEFQGMIPVREATRHDGRPASSYRLDLQGRIPLHALVLTVPEDSFSRTYRLEAIDGDPARPRPVTSGRLVRKPSGGPVEQKIAFEERYGRRFLLTVIDDRNAPLSLVGVRAQSAARQVVFEASRLSGGPVKLYYGNPKATAPHYDFAASLPRVLPEAPGRLFLGPAMRNPAFEPEPKPFTERSPWLIYLVLALASLALFAILMNLARSMGKPVEP